MRYLNAFFPQPAYAGNGGSLRMSTTSVITRLPNRCKQSGRKSCKRCSFSAAQGVAPGLNVAPGVNGGTNNRLEPSAKSLPEPSPGHKPDTFQALLLFVQRVFVKEAHFVPASEVLYIDTDSGAIEVADSRQNYFGDGLTSVAVLRADRSDRNIDHQNTLFFRLPLAKKMNRRVIIVRDHFQNQQSFQCFVSTSFCFDGQEFVSGTYSAHFTLRRNVSGLAPELLFVGKNSRAFLEPLHT